MNTFITIALIIIIIAIIVFILLFKVIKWLAICIIVIGIVLSMSFFGFGVWPLYIIDFSSFVIFHQILK